MLEGVYDDADLVDCWHGASCSCVVSLRQWNLISHRFRGLTGAKTTEKAVMQAKPEVNLTVANRGSHLSLLSLVRSRTKGARERKIQK